MWGATAAERLMLQTASGPTSWRRAGLGATRVTAWIHRLSFGEPGEAACMLNEEAARGRRLTLRGGQRGFYLHVDDGIVPGTNGPSPPRRVGLLMEDAACGLGAAGFVVPDRRKDSEVHKVAGCVSDRDPARLRLSGRKAALLSSALCHASRSYTVDCEKLRAVVGVLVWAALLRRDVLSVAAAVFEA